MIQQGKILILGGGPTGLGAAYQLHTAGYTNWLLLEQHERAGDLSRSFRDAQGFTWDIGVHVVYSQHARFMQLLSDLLGTEGWFAHERECWIHLLRTWVPYPFQLNLRYLPPELCAACLSGLLTAARTATTRPYQHFDDFIVSTFGEGIADLFMRPYNRKVWGYDPRELNAGWIGERVAVPDPVRVARNITLGQDDVAWGGNNQFRFPRQGGTGAIWNALAARLPAERLRLRCAAVGIDAARQLVYASDGTRHRYDTLISTLPLPELAALCGKQAWIDAAAPLKHSSVHVVGVGLRGQPPPELHTKCWMYFPEADVPFYRVTHFSHFSAHNVADQATQWSLMSEVAESPRRPVNTATLGDDVIRALCRSGMISAAEQVTHTWSHRVEYGYPTPSQERDAVLRQLLPALYEHHILSRGRFGAWLYEVGNMDHSFMQGVEAANHLLRALRS